MAVEKQLMCGPKADNFKYITCFNEQRYAMLWNWRWRYGRDDENRGIAIAVTCWEAAYFGWDFKIAAVWAPEFTNTKLRGKGLDGPMLHSASKGSTFRNGTKIKACILLHQNDY